jgi:hypothetical protein
MRLVQLSRELSVRDVGRDEGCEGDAGRGGEEERDFADSTDVFFAVFGAESEVLGRAPSVGKERREGGERTLFNPNRMLSPSNRKACSFLCSKCCSSAVAMVDYR